MVTGAKVYNTCNMIVLEMYPVRGGTSDVRLRNKGVREDTFEKKSVCLLKREVSQVALVVKNLLVNAGDVKRQGSIPGSGRSPGEGISNPLQYSCLENPIDRGAWRATVHGVAESFMTEAT